VTKTAHHALDNVVAARPRNARALMRLPRNNGLGRGNAHLSPPARR
jgi:hypothetical protein